MSERNNGRKTKTIGCGQAVREGYEGKVVAEAMTRNGKNPQIKGVIHEIMHRDAFNANPGKIIKGEHARLVKSPTAEVVDTVVMRGGKVVQRLQLKDTPASMAKMVEKVNSGQYRTAQVLGTKETAARAVGKTVKEVKSSGISSETTARIAAKTGNGTGSLAGGLGKAAKCGGVAGAAISGGLALGGGIIDLVNGERELGEVARNVAKETAGGGIAGAAAATAGSLATTGTVVAVGAVGASGALATVAVIAAPAAVALAVGWGVKSLWDTMFD